jgi:predicted transcriptional regulator
VTAGIKNEARELVEHLPEDSTWDDLMRLIYERLVIDRGLADFEAGRKVNNDEVRRRFGLEP